MKYALYSKCRRFAHTHFPWLINGWRAINRFKCVSRIVNPLYRTMFHSFSLKDRFTAIYQENYWSNPEALSGYGSTVSATANTRHSIQYLISKYGIKSLLDVPCGDFNWMKHLDLCIHYTGGDIVDDLITRNNQFYGNELRKFLVLDITSTALPRNDLLLCRECLNHLSFEHIMMAITNIRNSGIKFIAVTHYPEFTVNHDKASDEIYRPLNLCLPPFNWPPPKEIFPEIETGDTPSEIGKTLSFWEI